VRYTRPLTPCLVELDILLVVHVLLDDFQWCTTYVVGHDSQSHDLGSISQSRLRYQLEETLGNLIHKHFTTVHLRALPSSFRGATIQAADLMKDHTLVVPDLRGIGRSAKPEAAMTRKPRPKICAPL